MPFVTFLGPRPAEVHVREAPAGGAVPEIASRGRSRGRRPRRRSPRSPCRAIARQIAASRCPSSSLVQHREGTVSPRPERSPSRTTGLRFSLTSAQTRAQALLEGRRRARAPSDDARVVCKHDSAVSSRRSSRTTLASRGAPRWPLARIVVVDEPFGTGFGGGDFLLHLLDFLALRVLDVMLGKAERSMPGERELRGGASPRPAGLARERPSAIMALRIRLAPPPADHLGHGRDLGHGPGGHRDRRTTTWDEPAPWISARDPREERTRASTSTRASDGGRAETDKIYLAELTGMFAWTSSMLVIWMTCSRWVTPAYS